MDVTTITGAVDFAPYATGVGVIFAAMVTLKLALAGGRKLLGAIR